MERAGLYALTAGVAVLLALEVVALLWLIVAEPGPPVENSTTYAVDIVALGAAIVATGYALSAVVSIVRRERDQKKRKQR